MINLRKNQPKFSYKLNVALVSFFAFWFTAVVAVMVAIGCIYGENVVTYGVMIGGFALFFIGVAVIYFLKKMLYGKYVDALTAKFEKDFAVIPFEEAERILKERGVITETGFAVGDGVFGEETIPFETALFYLETEFDGNAEMKLCVYSMGENRNKAVYTFDGAMLSFLSGKETNLDYNEEIMLLRRNKREFAESISKSLKIFEWKFK